MADVTDKAREEFFSEAQEIIEGLSKNLLALDAAMKSETEDPALVNEAFRAVHTLKGLAGLFGASKSRSDPFPLNKTFDQVSQKSPAML